MKATPGSRAAVAIGVWLAGLIVCGIVIVRTEFTADMSAFLPSAPTAEQRILVDQLRDGALSRLVLIGIEGADAETRSTLSRALGESLRASNAFTGVHNGDERESRGDREYFFANRYLLSDAVTAERFSVDGLTRAIQESIDQLASPAGMMLKSILPRDPTGETLRLVDSLSGGSRPETLNGTWASKDGERALLIAQTRATGSDIDGQQRALDLIAAQFAKVRDATAKELLQTASALQSAQVIVSGSGAFAVSSRATIQREVLRLSLLSATIVIALLLLIYRSVRALGLGLLPVVTGGIAAVAAVSLGFGTVHGLTLGFGTTLIGEAVDYSIYLFLQSERGDNAKDADQRWVERFWPTIRLGVLTSIFGFASLLFSGFPGLAQLGLYSITGLVVAAAVTRFVLPHLLPRNFRVRDISPVGVRIERWTAMAGKARWTIAVAVVVAGAVLFAHRATLWNKELSALSPVPAADLARHERLRADIGAPDSRYLVIASGVDQESALRASEQATVALQPLVDAGALSGFESPSRFLPSASTQAMRRQALPAPDELRRRLVAATADLPLRAERLEPFIADVEAARKRPPLGRADLEGTSLAEAVDALLMRQGAVWNAVIPLRPPAASSAAPAAAPAVAPAAAPGAAPGAAIAPSATIDPARIRAALAEAKVDGALFVDVGGETQALYAAYLRQAILLSLAGVVAIALLLLITLRSVGRMVRVLVPLIASVLVVAAGIAAAGMQLTIMHLIGMLLIVAIGSNYALFFDQRAAGDGSDTDGSDTDGRRGRDDGVDRADGNTDSATSRARLFASLLCANITTVAGFGLLAFSSVPVLKAIGITVGPGAVLALVFAAILASPSTPRPAQPAAGAGIRK